ncbi:MAG: hypothetical protein KAS78_02140 [Candidatus Pacebacteria bacterium]|nr:hypothetical protein [Candidatus Paceibacterota bacterium]
MARLTKNTKIVRDEVLIYAWSVYKNRITMKELAEIFQIDLARVYQILKNDKSVK